MFQFIATGKTQAELLASLQAAVAQMTAGVTTSGTTIEQDVKAAETNIEEKSTQRRRSRADAKKDDIQADQAETSKEDTKPAGGRRRRSVSVEKEAVKVNDNEAQAAVRQGITDIATDFSEYPDLVQWVTEYLQRIGCTLLTEIPTADLDKVAADFKEKEKSEFPE